MLATSLMVVGLGREYLLMRDKHLLCFSYLLPSCAIKKSKRLKIELPDSFVSVLDRVGHIFPETLNTI